MQLSFMLVNTHNSYSLDVSVLALVLERIAETNLMKNEDDEVQETMHDPINN